jgi:threonine/homoserine/homoserine lactone efflux protein
MVSAGRLAVFISASLALLVIPGPAVLYIITRSLGQGKKAGLFSVLGIEIGSLIHVAAAALGLSALLMRSATLYSVVKYLGAAYLVYLGVRRLLEPAAALPARVEPIGSPSRILRQGIVVNVLNPKTALFFFAFLPQFVEPAFGHVALQVVLLGLLFVGMATITDGAYALLSGTLRGTLAQSRAFPVVQRYGTGAVYIGLGLGAALSGGKGK